MQAVSAHSGHSHSVSRDERVVFFNDLVGIGERTCPQGTKPFFWVKDFPLPRKGGLWDTFSSTLHFQPNKLFLLSPKTVHFSYPKIASITETPSFEEWEKSIKAFKKSTLKKVVLARKTTIHFEQSFSPFDLFSYLKQTYPQMFVFAVIVSSDTGFIGATPEKLFTRKGQSLAVDALAGTKKSFEKEKLRASAKDLREFFYVKERLKEQLTQICKPFETKEEIFLKEAGDIAHLFYPFSLELQTQLSDFDLIDRLHPTPAIAGLPRDEALKFIQEWEPFDRGYYGGTLGLLSQKKKLYLCRYPVLPSSKRVYAYLYRGWHHKRF